MPDSRRRPPRKPCRTITDPREAALAVLNRLDSDHTTLDHLLDDIAPQISGLSRRDRALFNQLIHGVLRWRLRLDAVVETFANRPLKKISPTIFNILRLGLMQILFMDRIPPSAVVNTAVNLARAQKAIQAAGFVNALLRNVLREPERFVLPDAAVSPVDHMALDKSFPHWLVARWIDRYGVPETGRLCDAMNSIPPVTLRCNTLKNSLAELVDALRTQAADISPMDNLPGAVSLIGPRLPIHEMQAFIDGRFAVQDGAAQLVSLLLAPRPDESILDACAGLGGKTTHIAQIMQNRGCIVALDNLPTKLTRLEKEALRQGISIIQTRRGDLNRPLSSHAPPAFDRILLDAPCTGLGVLRRNPDAKWSAQKKDIARYADRQARFLDHLAPLVKTGGVLVFSVCSMEPEENEEVITRFLINHPNFAISNYQTIEEKRVLPFLDQHGFLRTTPHNHQMDGFFAARLLRRC